MAHQNALFSTAGLFLKNSKITLCSFHFFGHSGALPSFSYSDRQTRVSRHQLVGDISWHVALSDRVSNSNNAAAFLRKSECSELNQSEAQNKRDRAEM